MAPQLNAAQRRLVLGSEQDRRWTIASRTKTARRVKLPHLADWNYSACAHHEVPTPQCEYRECGFDPFDHQTVSATFHYVSQKSIDASQTGTGKTNSILLTLCLAKHYGEPLKAILVVPTSAVRQWLAETQRFAPGLHAVAISSGMTREKRMRYYSSNWEVLIIGFHLAARDSELLGRTGHQQLVCDDVDPILQSANMTHKNLLKLATPAKRVIIANATNLQTRLTQLYCASLFIGGKNVWGSKDSFETLYIKKSPVYIEVRKGEVRKTVQATGYKNLTDFKERFTPMMIRHRYDDLVDLRIPEIITQDIFIPLHPAQRAKYDLLQEGVLELMRKDGTPQQKQVSAVTAWTHGGQICAGLPALGEDDGPGASSKLDWLMDHLTGEWSDQKVVTYWKNRGTISALQARLDREGIGYGTIWGAQPDAAFRAEEQSRFWKDPNCKVMILSSAGERSLNLQNAAILVMGDLQLNPSRVVQLMGRIRRAGSAHHRVVAISLLATDTQEERYAVSLASRQALFDAVHDEDSGDLFERLDPEVLLRLIRP